MHFSFEIKDKLPPLGWYAECKKDQVAVICGNRVEYNENFFVEGAWDGDFVNGEFTKSEWLCGTGAKIEKDSIVFSTPSHVTSGLFMSKIAGGVLTIQ